MTKLWCLITKIIEFKYLNDIWPVFLRVMTSITSSLFLISKCSRITSLQSLFFNFLESNVLLSLGQCMNCFLVSKTIRVFSHSNIKYRPQRRITMYLLVFRSPKHCSYALRFAHGISGRVLCHQSFAPRVLHPSHDSWLRKISRTQIQVYSVAKYRPHLSHFWENVIFAIPFQ